MGDTYQQNPEGVFENIEMEMNPENLGGNIILANGSSHLDNLNEKQGDENFEVSNDTNSDQSARKKPIFIISKLKKTRNWTEEEDSLLVKTARKFRFRNWNEIAKCIPGRTPVQCTARFKRIKPGIVKGAWVAEEDELLKSLIEKYGRNWSLISKHMPSRNGKQIRDRFINSLDPDIIRDKFTSQEDSTILELYAKFGTSWSRIAKQLPGRTSDLIKNRFYSTLRKQIHCYDYLETLKRRKRTRDRLAQLKNQTKNKLKVNNSLRIKLKLRNNQVYSEVAKNVDFKENDKEKDRKSGKVFTKIPIEVPIEVPCEVEDETKKMTSSSTNNNLNNNNFTPNPHFSPCFTFNPNPSDIIPQLVRNLEHYPNLEEINKYLLWSFNPGDSIKNTLIQLLTLNAINNSAAQIEQFNSHIERLRGLIDYCNFHLNLGNDMNYNLNLSTFK